MIKRIEYFPLDTHIFNDEKFQLLISEFGLEASAIAIKLLCEIYSNNFYLNWNLNRCKIFTNYSATSYSREQVQAIVDFLLEVDFFDKGMYEAYGILTSKGIQKRFFEITRRRKKYTVDCPEYLLVDITDKNIAIENPHTNTELNPKNVDKNEIQTELNLKNVDNFSQRKEKERKGTERKELISNKPAAREAEKIEVENIEEVEAEEVTVKDEERMNFHEWCHAHKAELRESEDWIASVVRASGRGTRIVSALPAIFDMFDNHVITIGQENDLRDVREYKRRFVVWWRSLDFKRPEEITNRRECFATNGMSGRPRGKSRIEDIMQACDEGAEIALRILKQKENERFRA